jgi:anti-anti-sigma factor
LRGAVFLHSGAGADASSGKADVMLRPVIRLSGELDVYGARTACRVLDAIEGPAIVDMSGVGFVDGCGLSELARVAKRAGPGNVVLVVPSVQIRRVLAIVRFPELFCIVERIDDVYGADASGADMTVSDTR